MQLGKKIKHLVSALGRTALGPSTAGESDAERYWSHAFEHGGVTTWMSEERCRLSINELISGSPKNMKAVAGKTPIFGFYGSGETGPKDNNSAPCGVGYHIIVCAIRAK